MFGEETSFGKVITFIDMPFSTVAFGGGSESPHTDMRRALLEWWSDGSVGNKISNSMFSPDDENLIQAAVSDTLASNGSSDAIFDLLSHGHFV